MKYKLIDTRHLSKEGKKYLEVTGEFPITNGVPKINK